MSKTYPIVCPSCGGLGYIGNPAPVSSVATIVCPACNGSKVVMAVVDDNLSPHTYTIKSPSLELL